MLLSLKELILKAWDLYLDNFKKLWTLVALPRAGDVAPAAP